MACARARQSLTQRTGTHRRKLEHGRKNQRCVVLKVAGISKRFGGLPNPSDVGITIQRGQVYGLIGPNNAGKTTLFNVITGLYTPDSGIV